MKRQWVSVGLGALLALHAATGEALASAVTAPAAPEIGPGSISAGLAILAGGVLVLRSRFRSK